MENYFIIFKDTVVPVGRWVERHNGFITALATIAIALFTLVLWWATRKLWKVAQEQSKDMKKSLTIAEEAADAAKKGAEVAERALHISEQAYLTVDHFAFKKPLEVGKKPEIKMSIINNGRTPAQIIELFTQIDILK